MSLPHPTSQRRACEQRAGGTETSTTQPVHEAFADHFHGCGHTANDHYAQVHETSQEELEAAAAFIKQGLSNGGECIYVIDDHPKAAIVETLESQGVDAEHAVECDQLDFRTVEETYFNDGTFDPDEMVDFYREMLETREADGQLRIVVGTRWLTNDSIDVAEFMEYEAKVNALFDEFDFIALCQYNRERFPAETLQQVIATHPNITYKDQVCQNVYYTPPTEFFGEENPDRELDRMLGTLFERSVAQAELETHLEFLQRFSQLTAQSDRPFEATLEELLKLGRERFELACGGIARATPDQHEWTIEHVSESAPFATGDVLSTAPESTEHPAVTAAGIGNATNGAGRPGETIPLGAYLGSAFCVEGGHDRLVFFCTAGEQGTSFSERDRSFQQLIGQWVKAALERTFRQDGLAGLNQLSRELTHAESTRDCAEEAIEVATTALSLANVAIGLYENPTDGLEIVAQSPIATLEAFDGGDHLELAMDAFVADETRRAGPSSAAHTDDHETVLSEMLAVPLGNHGALIIGTAVPSGWSSSEIEYIETVAGTIAAAMDRAHREEQVRTRESELAAKNERLERVNLINTIIRNIDQALVNAGTHEDIEAVVCQKLVEAGPYDLAWIGKPTPTGDGLDVRHTTGDGDGYLDSAPLDDIDESMEPVCRATRTGEYCAINDLLERRRKEAWRQTALSSGYHATIALPLEYEGTLYGVLGVYADNPDVFGSLEQNVLAEMSDTIAHAINAVESKKALVSDEYTELEFEISDSQDPAFVLTAALDCDISIDALIPAEDGSIQAIFTTRNLPDKAAFQTAGDSRVPARVREAFSDESELTITELTHVGTLEQRGATYDRFKVTLTKENIYSVVLDHGAIPKEVTITDGQSKMHVEMASDGSVRDIVHLLESNYDEVTLCAQRTIQRQQRSRAEFHSALTDGLTDRQLEILQTAYWSGYFERPRAQTGSEIADSLDITQPTFNHHLRAGQRKVCHQLFEETPIQFESTH